MTDRKHIVMVDDEPGLRELVIEYLLHQGFAASGAADASTLRQIITEHSVDLVLLDIMMPGEDGLTLARYLREHYRLGIIMLTAKTEVIDRVVGLEVGADDYLTKPFDLRELLARIKSVLRRLDETAAHTQAGPARQPNGVLFGRCRFDVDSHKLYAQDNQEIPITAMEFALLKVFAEHPNRILNRDRLLDLAHHREWDPFDRSIDIRISRLRRKIEPDPANPQTIKTVRGAGYMFVPGRTES